MKPVGPSSSCEAPVTDQLAAVEGTTVQLSESDYKQAAAQIRADLGNGLVEAELVQNKESSCLLLKDIKGNIQVLKLPKFFQPFGLVVKDLGRDGDLDLIVLQKNNSPIGFERGALVYQNLAGQNPGDSSRIEADLSKPLKSFERDKVRDIVKNYLAVSSSDKFAKALITHFAKRDSYSDGEYRLHESLFKTLESIYLQEDLVQILLPFFRQAIEREDSLGDDLFMYGLAPLSHNMGAEILARLPAEKAGEAFCRSVTRNDWYMSHREVGINNALLKLHEAEPTKAAEISEKMVCSYYTRKFPYPGIDGFKSWAEETHPSNAADYINYLLGSKLPKLIRKGLEILHALRRTKDPLLLELGKNGLSEEGMRRAYLYDSLDNALLEALETGDVKAFWNADQRYLLNFIQRYPLSHKETAILIAGIGPSHERFCQELALSLGTPFMRGVFKELHGISPETARQLLTSLGKTAADVDFTGYKYKSVEIHLKLTGINPVLVYEMIQDLPLPLLADVLSIDPEDRLENFEKKSSYLVKLEFDRPELFPQLFHKLKGPFIGPSTPPRAAAARLEEFLKMGNGKAEEIVIKIFNSSHIDSKYLEEVMSHLAAQTRKALFEYRNGWTYISNYRLRWRFFDEPLKTDPREVYQFLYQSAYFADPEIKNQIRVDISLLSDSDFLRVVETFKRNDLGSWGFLFKKDSYSIYMDRTGLGWIYEYLRAIGDEHKLKLLVEHSDGYFDQVDLLRSQFGIPLNLYRRGPFSTPLSPEELAFIAGELKKLPPEKLDTIKGITILDEFPVNGVLGEHDFFDNIVLFRKYPDPKLIKEGIRTKEISFMDEFTTVPTLAE